MSRSRSRLAADWFAKLRVNSTTQAVEHTDVEVVDAATAAAIANIPPSNDASALTTGTLPDGRFPATLPAVSGANLTGIVSIPSGLISMWSGSAAAIPSGWNLCDGTNGTPNLVGKFIKAASTAGGTGGSNTHSHSHTLSAGAHTLSIAEMPSHSHTFGYTGNTGGGPTRVGSADNNNIWYNQTTSSTGGSGSHSHSLSGSISSGSNEPAYFELCYIMKA